MPHYAFPASVKRVLESHDWRLRPVWHPRRGVWVIVLLRSAWEEHLHDVFYGEGLKNPAYNIEYVCSTSGDFAGIPRKPDMRCYETLRKRDLNGYEGGGRAYLRNLDLRLNSNDDQADAKLQERLTYGSKELFKKTVLNRDQVGYIPSDTQSTRRMRS